MCTAERAKAEARIKRLFIETTPSNCGWQMPV
jgi:hypothetical protein